MVVEKHAVKLDFSTLLTMSILFFVLSFFSIGGAVSVIPEIHRQAVEVSHWLTEREFVDLISIAQAAPGPNVLFVTLIGYQVSGITGALLATFFMCGPACAVAFCIAQIFHRFREKKWRIAVQAADHDVGDVVVLVLIGVTHVAAPQNHCVVEKRLISL